MKTSVFLRVLTGLLALAVLVGVGAFAYQAGVVQGMAAGGQAEPVPAYAQAAAVAPVPFMYPLMPWAFGWLGCLAPLLLGLLFLGLIRFTFGLGRHGGWRRGWSGPGRGDMPPFVEEWHRRAHGQEAEPGGQSPSSI